MSSLLRSPKKEEQEVPDGVENWDELEGFLGISDTTKCPSSIEEEEEDDDDAHLWINCKEQGESQGWEFTSSNWEDELALFPKDQDSREESCNNNNEDSNVKREEVVGSYFGLGDEMSVNNEDTKTSLNLNLNYEQVLQAWSNRGSFWADHPSNYSFISNSNYYGEVPNLEEERTRRETSVQRYKEKRQNRLFSKKIRYEVRKLNADKRPRLKGRFVKRTPDKMLKEGQNISH